MDEKVIQPKTKKSHSNTAYNMHQAINKTTQWQIDDMNDQVILLKGSWEGKAMKGWWAMQAAMAAEELPV